LGNHHLVVDTAENGRFDEVTALEAGGLPRATQQLGTFLNPFLNVTLQPWVNWRSLAAGPTWVFESSGSPTTIWAQVAAAISPPLEAVRRTSIRDGAVQVCPVFAHHALHTLGHGFVEVGVVENDIADLPPAPATFFLMVSAASRSAWRRPGWNRSGTPVHQRVRDKIWPSLAPSP